MRSGFTAAFREARVEQRVGRVVVADGDVESRNLAAEVLQRAGYETVEVATGTEVLAEVRAGGVALVVLEVGLADMTGYEVCREIRLRNEELPVFFLSGMRTEPIDRVAGLLLGADDFIVKPFDPGELVARARRFVIRKRLPAYDPLPDPDAPKLTPREGEVLELLAEGRRQKEIAHELSISPKTVGTHVQNLLSKFDVHSRAELVARAYRENLAGSASR
jgi:DNA-binding NarL/FixJ family response regulator